MQSNSSFVAGLAEAQVRGIIEQSKLTQQEWAMVERAVRALADLAILGPAATPEEQQVIENRARLLSSTIKDIGLAKSIEVHGVIMDSVTRASQHLLNMGLAAIKAVAVAA